MGVPAWLLRIVMAFLKDRTMVVRFKGATSSQRSLLNVDKTKFMIFNTCCSIDCVPTFRIGGTEINLVEEMKLLGLIITTDL